MKKRLIIYLLVLLGVGHLKAQNCLPNGVVFTTQDQIDSFATDYPGCTQVLGHLTVQEVSPGTITNLDGLNQIVGIAGDLTIIGNTQLENLTGLQSLSFVTSRIRIDNNDQLVDLSGLELITFIGEDLWINNNESLTSLNGLHNLTTTSEEFRIKNNDNLTSLSALSNLNSIGSDILIEDNLILEDLAALVNITAVGGLLKIANNDALESITDLSNISSIPQLFITENASLLNLSGLESITTTLDYVKIIDNENLQNLHGLSNLTSIGGELELSSNPALQNMAGLESLSYIGDYFNVINTSFQDFAELESLTTIDNGLIVISNDSLVSFNGLDSLNYIGNNCFIFSNPVLQSLSGLENLTEIAGDLRISDSHVLENLEGLNNLISIGGDFRLFNNNALIDLLDLESLTTVGGGLLFQFNANLSICNAPFVCDYVLNGGSPIFEENAEGCNNESEVLVACLENIPHDNLVGSVLADIDQNCLESTEDENLGNWLVNAFNDDYSITVSTDTLGDYWIPLLEGDWNIQVISPSSFWTACFADSIIQSSANGDTLITDFLVSPEGDCPYIEWDFLMPTLRVCTLGVYAINYCNYGTLPGEDIVFSVLLDEQITLENASVPYTVEPDGTILFQIDTLNVFECDQFTFTAMTDCDSLEIDDVLCTSIGILPDDLCTSNALWDESTVVAVGTCTNDSIFFELENIGVGNMALPSQFRIDIVIDDIVLLYDVDDYQLLSGEKRTLAYPLEGTGMRLETNQSIGHPVAGEVSVVVPNCEDVENDILLTLLPVNNGDPFMETFCEAVIGSFDPNIKTARPIGLGPDHEIEKEWELDYTIQFQNTGNDTAFLVVVKDTLSENLDLNSIRVGSSSHPFTWELNTDRELVFSFENILLPDSTTNELASNGFVNFSIHPRADILPGELIENRVGIYFDFNDPVITNTVFHTIQKPVVATSEHLDWCAGVLYDDIEIWQDTSIQLLTEYVEYDSIHLLHFDVLPNSEDTLMLELTIGDYFENTLILGDTTFTQSYENQLGCDSLVTYVVDALTNVDDLNDFKKVKVFPNPVDDVLLVLSHENNEAQSWSLVNNLGVSVWKKQLRVNELLSSISIVDLPSGIYWLQVKAETSTAVWKVIKR